MKYEVYRNNYEQRPREMIGRVNSREAAERVVELDRASIAYHHEIMAFGQVSWTIIQIKSDQVPLEESGQQNRS